MARTSSRSSSVIGTIEGRSATSRPKLGLRGPKIERGQLLTGHLRTGGKETLPELSDQGGRGEALRRRRHPRAVAEPVEIRPQRADAVSQEDHRWREPVHGGL